MNTHDIQESIREVNLTFLVLAQRMLREDRATAMFRLGLSAGVAYILVGLSLAQVVKLASSDHLLCAFRFNDGMLLSALTRPQSTSMSRPLMPHRDGSEIFNFPISKLLA